jgi:HK97 family phage prohead protease
MQFINYQMKIKSFDNNEPGVFDGYASVFDEIDHQNEIVLPGAFTKSLERWNQASSWPKMLWQHDPTSPIGIWENMAEDQYGLFVKGRLLLDIQKGRDAYSLLKSGIVDGLSIGFFPKQSHKEGNVNVLEQIDLLEVSLVTFVANPLAKVTSCKHWTETYDQTIYLLNRLKSLKRAMDKTYWQTKSIMMEQM